MIVASFYQIALYELSSVEFEAPRYHLVPDVALKSVWVEVSDISRNRDDCLQPIFAVSSPFKTFHEGAFDVLLETDLYTLSWKSPKHGIMFPIGYICYFGFLDILEATVLKKNLHESLLVVLKQNQFADLVCSGTSASAESLKSEVVQEACFP